MQSSLKPSAKFLSWPLLLAKLYLVGRDYHLKKELTPFQNLRQGFIIHVLETYKDAILQVAESVVPGCIWSHILCLRSQEHNRPIGHSISILHHPVSQVSCSRELAGGHIPLVKVLCFDPAGDAGGPNPLLQRICGCLSCTLKPPSMPTTAFFNDA